MREDRSIVKESIFDVHESNVRSYCRNFPVVFTTAKGSELFTRDGRRFLDCLSGAGTLNYGHNHPAILEPVMSYLGSGSVLHSLDLHTEAKERFIETFHDTILVPRGMSYKLQFPGPTGTNAIEAALKLARKVTGRTNVVSFTNGFHGMTQGALSASANEMMRNGAGVELYGITHMPYDGFLGEGIDTMAVIEGMFLNAGSGVPKPAAFLLETVQGEGGLNVAQAEWLHRLESLARQIGALVIIDDIQAGIGRSGGYFSFEDCDLKPDIVVLSKSLSGFGSPFSLILLRPDIDIWKPGEHNGTFRGNNLAFVGAAAAIQHFWGDGAFKSEIAWKSARLSSALRQVAEKAPDLSGRHKGKAMFVGLEFPDESLAPRISAEMYKRGVIAETCGYRGRVLKFLPPLTISDSEIAEAMEVLDDVVTTLH